MKVVSAVMVIILFCGPLAGCISNEEIENTYIEDDSELNQIDAIHVYCNQQRHSFVPIWGPFPL